MLSAKKLSSFIGVVPWGRQSMPWRPCGTEPINWTFLSKLAVHPFYALDDRSFSASNDYLTSDNPKK